MGRRRAVAGVLGLVLVLLAGCGLASPDPAGSGGLIGHMSGTSDVEGQRGVSSIGGGGLAVVPIAAMERLFWELTGVERVPDPRAWSGRVVGRLAESHVTQMGGTSSPIDADGDFRLHAPPGEYAVCYWPGEVGARITGCDAFTMPAEGVLAGSWGEAGFHLGVSR